MIQNHKAGNAFDGAVTRRYDDFENEYQRFHDFLLKNVATATMAAAALNLYRPNACRYKRWLEEEGKLFELDKGICAVTGFPAKYLTTNPELRPKKKQQNLRQAHCRQLRLQVCLRAAMLKQIWCSIPG